MSWRSRVGVSKNAELAAEAAPGSAVQVGPRAVLTAALAAALWFLGGPARADGAMPPLHRSYPQDMLEGARQAVQRGDRLAAVDFYVGLTQAVPSRAYAFGRLCEQYEALGDRHDALGACRRAVTLEGPTAADFERLVWLIANGPQPLSIAARKELKDIQKHVTADDGAGTAGAYVICQAAMALHDRDALEGCTATLRRSAPQDPRTISSEWALAMERGDHDDARRLIARARTAGVPANGLATMETATRSIGPVRLFRAAAWALLEAAIFLLALSGSRQRFQRRRATG